MVTGRRRGQQLQQIMTDHADIFQVTISAVEHKIHTGDRHQSDRNPIEFPMREERLLKGSCMDEMLKAEGIRPSVSPWAAPIVLIWYQRKTDPPNFAFW